VDARSVNNYISVLNEFDHSGQYLERPFRQVPGLPYVRARINANEKRASHIQD